MKMRRCFILLLALIAMSAAVRPGPLGVAFAQADAAQVKTLAAGALVEVDLDGEKRYMTSSLRRAAFTMCGCFLRRPKRRR